MICEAFLIERHMALEDFMVQRYIIPIAIGIGYCFVPKVFGVTVSGPYPELSDIAVGEGVDALVLCIGSLSLGVFHKSRKQ